MVLVLYISLPVLIDHPSRQLAFVNSIRYAMRLNLESLRFAARTLRKRLHSLRIAPLATLYIVSTLLSTVLIASAVKTLVLIPLARYLFQKFGQVPHDNHAWDQASLQGGFVEQPGAIAIGGEGVGDHDDNVQYINEVDLRNVHITRPEATLFLSHLRPDDRYLEYGSNGLTGAVKARVKNVTTIEHRGGHWCTETADLYSDSIICAPVTAAHSWESLSHFVDAPRLNLSRGAKFDAVLLAGPLRTACALRVLPQLARGARVFYADYFRRPRSAVRVLRYYAEVGRVRARAPPYSYGLLVLTPKHHVSMPRELDVVRAAEEEHTGNPGRREVDWDWVERSEQGGLDLYEIAAKVSRASAVVRISLDMVLLALVVMGSKILYAGFWTALWPALNEAMIRSAKTGEATGITCRQGYSTA